MSLLLETIRFSNGIPENLNYHEARITMSQIALDGSRRLDSLTSIFEDTPPPPEGLIKGRLTYNRDLYKIEFSEYVKANILHLRIFEANKLYYPFKFANRDMFQRIHDDMPPDAEALIVISHRITDTTYTNVALKRQEKWYTPINPLLKGTRRAQLLEDGIIQLEDIFLDKLPDFEAIKLFNAMIPWDEAIEIPISQIINE